jgi:hypothetical protein
VAEDQEGRFPAWNWSQLSDAELRVELKDLADWVADLQMIHGRWVRLPACWPRHRGLRDELAAFWYWRQRLDQTKGISAEENVRWYQFLRSAAQTWAEAYAGCRHESTGEIDEKRIDRETEQGVTRVYLNQVLQELMAHAVSVSGIRFRGVDGPLGDGGPGGSTSL